jgi:hypothetical protein
MGARFDTRELVELSRSLEKAIGVTSDQAAPVVTKGAVNIKADARKRVSGLRHARRYPASITFDPVRTIASRAWTEIGPDKDRPQGALGNILEFGTINNPPHPHMEPAGRAEAPRFEKALEDLAVKALGF